MLHKLSRDANSMVISLASIIIAYTNIFLFSERILPEYQTRDVEISNSMARSMKLRCCLYKTGSQ